LGAHRRNDAPPKKKKSLGDSSGNPKASGKDLTKKARKDPSAACPFDTKLELQRLPLRSRNQRPWTRAGEGRGEGGGETARPEDRAESGGIRGAIGTTLGSKPRG